MLRELLEDCVSRTHRQAVRKVGVLFLLLLDPGTAPDEPTLSRAHMHLEV